MGKKKIKIGKTKDVLKKIELNTHDVSFDEFNAIKSGCGERKDPPTINRS